MFTIPSFSSIVTFVSFSSYLIFVYSVSFVVSCMSHYFSSHFIYFVFFFHSYISLLFLITFLLSGIFWGAELSFQTSSLFSSFLFFYLFRFGSLLFVFHRGSVPSLTLLSLSFITGSSYCYYGRA